MLEWKKLKHLKNNLRNQVIFLLKKIWLKKFIYIIAVLSISKTVGKQTKSSRDKKEVLANINRQN